MKNMYIDAGYETIVEVLSDNTLAHNLIKVTLNESNAYSYFEVVKQTSMF